MVGPVFIYALCEPDTGEIRYVGKSSAPDRRFADHTSARATAPVRAWVDGLRNAGRVPEFRILEAVAAERGCSSERRVIAKLPRSRLLNVLALAPAATDVSARALLREFLVLNGITCREAATALHVKHTSVLQWIVGRNRPQDHRQAIETWTGGKVPASSWLRKSEQKPISVQPFRPCGTEG